jgi:nucleoside-triphosphatase THEP1
MELVLPPVDSGGAILVISGWRGVGKTALCEKIVAQARRAERKVAGLLSPGRFADGEKNGFFAVDLVTRETRLLASAVTGEIVGLQLGPWAFDVQVLEWGNRCLKQSTRPDLLVIDEIGPLEFERETGWWSSFEVLRRKSYQLALVVIRPEFLEAFSNLGFVYQAVEVTKEAELEHLAASISALVNS